MPDYAADVGNIALEDIVGRPTSQCEVPRRDIVENQVVESIALVTRIVAERRGGTFGGHGNSSHSCGAIRTIARDLQRERSKEVRRGWARERERESLLKRDDRAWTMGEGEPWSERTCELSSMMFLPPACAEVDPWDRQLF